MKVDLTEREIRILIEACDWGINEAYSAKQEQKFIKVQDKLEEALENADRH